MPTELDLIPPSNTWREERINWVEPFGVGSIIDMQLGSRHTFSFEAIEDHTRESISPKDLPKGRSVQFMVDEYGCVDLVKLLPIEQRTRRLFGLKIPFLKGFS